MECIDLHDFGWNPASLSELEMHWVSNFENQLKLVPTFFLASVCVHQQIKESRYPEEQPEADEMWDTDFSSSEDLGKPSFKKYRNLMK